MVVKTYFEMCRMLFEYLKFRLSRSFGSEIVVWPHQVCKYYGLENDSAARRTFNYILRRLERAGYCQHYIASGRYKYAFKRETLEQLVQNPKLFFKLVS